MHLLFVSVSDMSFSYQVLVCAPSNVAVDQLAEKISATGLKVENLNSACGYANCHLTMLCVIIVVILGFS